ncbi:SOS response-associated peptidase [Schleiferilactobacillus perolens]|jgi:putative SOS response-associated peptidase YedK|uniref:SOS response-associated peptidase n=1 Tax=Schleiferilactobacillus perolens TaxID=100468 RepID=UPI00070EC120|nr:SOS response-associated peptidase family protein [Schleiferilactobacillus perolens]MCI1891480.1 SOS response-associated peptidase [Schleiferilactobacillus harbinensis]MCI1911896.1 SOS response-associated peptidase [Schleiferilactobacillus harbinensis]MCI2170476.1 SOS response-associated peptidase [Schleiferilactobacillus perolens]
MCGRFYVDVRHNKRLRQLADTLAAHDMPVKTGEVFPTDHAGVILRHDDRMAMGSVVWGFPGFKAKQLIINARSETVMIKEMFKAPFLRERCVFPMSGFFEWSKDKEKNYFTDPHGKILLVGGFLAHFPAGTRSIILTTTPNDAVAKVHDRMPLLIPHKELKNWLFNDDFAVKQLREEMDELQGSTEDPDAVLN